MLLMDIWFNLAKSGPVCGLAVGRKDRTMHAVTADAVIPRIADKRTTIDAPCGTRVRIIPGDGLGAVFMWPPPVSLLPEGWTRCAKCQAVTGNRRPHPAWRARIEEEK